MRQQLIAIAMVLINSVAVKALAQATCRDAFGEASRYFDVEKHHLSPLPDVDDLRSSVNRSQSDLLEINSNIQNLEQWIEKSSESSSGFEALNNQNKIQLNQWISSRKRSVELLPRELSINSMVTDYRFMSFDYGLNLLRMLQFSVRNEAELFAIANLFADFVVTRAQLSELLHIISQKSDVALQDRNIKGSTLKNGAIIKKPLVAEFSNLINLAIDSSLFDSSLRSAIEKANTFRSQSYKQIYLSLRILEKLRLEAALVRSRLLQTSELFDAKLLENKLYRIEKLDTIEVSGVQYPDLHPTVAAVYLKLLKEIGSEYAKYITHIGVLTRPESFITDVKKMSLAGKTAEQNWQTINSKTFKFYRKISLNPLQANYVENLGMQSGFLRSGRNENESDRFLLTNSVWEMKQKHTEGFTSDSAFLSATPVRHSALAFGIASHFARVKDDPIYEYEIEVHKYDVMISEDAGSDLGKYEVFLWSSVHPKMMKNIGVESRNTPIDEANAMREIRQNGSLPQELVGS